MASPSPPYLTLYGYYKSSCTTRLRIALGLKGIAYESIYVDFFGKEQRQPEYAAINPSLTLPTLVAAEHPGPPAPQDLYITQSVAALEFLEDQDVFPATTTTPSLLPATPADRARMRALVEIISGDTQPRAASHTLEMLVGIVGPLTTAERIDAVRVLWAHDWHVRGFHAYDQLLAAAPSRYSIGDTVTLADVCLVPAVWNATERWGVQLNAFPTLTAVYERLMALPAVQAAHWRRQPDCPPELREK